eukprot:m.339726 g.339726  ORF g.339726 m.339726 type:complete len:312 (-) comp18934_c0_seq1:81-1016(-)
MTTIDQLVSDREVVQVDAKNTVLDAFKVLVDNHILSAPIYDAEQKKYVGFFDMCDMGAYLVETIKDAAPGGAHEIPMEFCDVGDLLDVVGKIHPKTMEAVSNMSGRDEFKSVVPGAPLQQVFDLLAAGHHRVVVIDSATGLAKSIISQSAILKFVNDHGQKVLAGLHHKSLKDVGLGVGQKMVFCYSDEPVMKAFSLMNEHKLSGIPLINRNGTIDTSISWTDLRVTVAAPKFNFRLTTALEFVQRSRALDSALERPAVVTTRMDSPVLKVIGQLAATGLHRIYVVDEKRHVTGVVSLKDIIKCLLQMSTE